MLFLGTHLDDPYPEGLRELADAELRRWSPATSPSARSRRCGARDWSALDQRMHYIVHLFRTLHERADLATPPFTPAQLRSIAAGTIPDGAL